MKYTRIFLVFLLSAGFAFGQRTVTGVVSDPDGLPLPGATVIIDGTTSGVTTDFDGNYSIAVEEGVSLVFSFVGYESQSVVVGSQNTLNISLSEGNQLSEVVVTALGLEREARSLGYAVTTVGSEEIEQKGVADVARTLTGKVAGVNITNTTSTSGSGTNVIIRGMTSITGSNQPLFVVDGVPFNSSTNGESGSFWNGITESSRFLDLDPNSIEKVDVLKGLNATVLYGQQGRNGVILITTKNGSGARPSAKGTEVTVSHSTFVNEPVLPDYQNDYGGGFHQLFGFFFSNGGPNFDPAINDPRQFGPYYLREDANNVYVKHPYDYIANRSLVEPEFADLVGTEYAYRNYRGVENFFDPGLVNTTSLNLRSSGDNGFFNMSFGRTDDEGFTPNNRLRKTNFGIGGAATLENGIRINGTLNYANTDYTTPPIAASLGSGSVSSYTSSIFGDVMYTPRSVDLMGLPYITSDGRSIYYRSGNDIQNPRWTAENAFDAELINRVFGTFGAAYDINDNWTLAYKYGIDNTSQFSEHAQNKGGVDGNATGIYVTSDEIRTIQNHSFTLSFNDQLDEDWSLTALVGADANRETYTGRGTTNENQLVFGVLKPFNFVSQSANSYDSEQNIYGAFADLSFNYNDYLYLNVTGRQDWSSTMEAENNSLFYKGASLSFIASDVIPALSGDIVNYAKLRVGYGESAGFANPYRTRSLLSLNAKAFDPGSGVIQSNTTSNTLGNEALEPELLSEVEIGIDTRLFNFLNFNVSVYDKNTTNLITTRTLPGSTGFTSTTVNAGKLNVKGVEVDWDANLVNNGDLRWNLYGNFTAEENLIESLGEGVQEFTYTPVVSSSRPQNYAIVGYPLGMMKANVRQTNDAGEFLIDDDGFYIETTEPELVGDPNPDWTAGITNSISWNGLSLDFTWQYRHGGDMFSQDAATLVGRGVLNPGTNREGLYVLDGVNKNTGQTNTTQITAINYGFDIFSFGPGELQIFDATTIRLSEVNLSYDFPRNLLERTPFGSLTATLTGINLFYDAVNVPDVVNFDSNVLSTGVGNAMGLSFITGPSSRRVGLTLKATF
jgi:TonB-linked SusC/RagA family outer membrane protein